MPNVIIETVEGKTIDQKRKVAKEITDVLVDNFNVEPVHVNIRFLDVKKADLAKAGKLFIDVM